MSPGRFDLEIPGDHSEGATPVPFPNTEVKPFTPMVVVRAARVGRCPVNF